MTFNQGLLLRMDLILSTCHSRLKQYVPADKADKYTKQNPKNMLKR